MAKANIKWNANGESYIEPHERTAIERGDRGDCRAGALHVDHDNNVWCDMEQGPRLVGYFDVVEDATPEAPDARDDDAPSEPPSWPSGPDA